MSGRSRRESGNAGRQETRRTGFFEENDMSEFYILGIDQSTQGTKGVLVDDRGRIIGRADRLHD